MIPAEEDAPIIKVVPKLVVELPVVADPKVPPVEEPPIMVDPKPPILIPVVDTPPTILSASASSEGETLTVLLSEPVWGVANASDFSITGENAPTVTAVTGLASAVSTADSSFDLILSADLLTCTERFGDTDLHTTKQLRCAGCRRECATRRNSGHLLGIQAGNYENHRR